jgi:hypothetical protein
MPANGRWNLIQHLKGQARDTCITPSIWHMLAHSGITCQHLFNICPSFLVPVKLYLVFTYFKTDGHKLSLSLSLSLSVSITD